MSAWTVLGCGATPEDAVRGALAAVEAADSAQLRRWVDPEYTDGRGGQTVLAEDVQAWQKTYPRRSLNIDHLDILRSGTSRLRADARVAIDLILSGATPSVRARGPLLIELLRNQGFRVQSGLLTEVRDVLEVMAERRAALEANDAEALAALLHPRYSDGSYNRHHLIDRLRRDLEGRVVRIEPTAYRIELRSGRVHVDEHHRMSIDGRELGPAVARLTFAQSAGRLRIQAGLRTPDDSTPSP